MSRIAPALAVFGALATIVPAHAADYINTLPQNFRTSYEPDWDMSDDGDPLDFEFGLRYWYSKGNFGFTGPGGDYSADDTSHILELHGRIDDNSTRTYAKGQVGYSVAISTDYSNPNGSGTAEGGQIGYAGADFGYLGFGNGNFGFGGFVGYQFWDDSPSTSTSQDVYYNMLRVGLAGRAKLGNVLDLTAEAALVPYAGAGGTYNGLGGGATSGGELSGNLYGAAGDVMLGFHPTDNLVVRGGARAWYLTGPAQLTYSTGGGTTTTTTSDYSLLRYGAVAEITGSF